MMLSSLSTLEGKRPLRPLSVPVGVMGGTRRLFLRHLPTSARLPPYWFDPKSQRENPEGDGSRVGQRRLGRDHDHTKSDRARPFYGP